MIDTQNQSKECQGLVLQSFLIMPVQRIPRYRLLLMDLVKHSDKNDDDYKLLCTALELCQDVATFVNETIRDQEMIQQMLEIQKSLIGLPDSLFIPGRRRILY